MALRSSHTLGPLELRVLEELWVRGSAATVRELMPGFGGTAYTTVMTTADRLYRKGLLIREPRGRAFAYAPRWTREQLDVHLAGSTVASLLTRDGADLKPIISLFVDEVSRRDRAMLDELEALIRRKKEQEP